MDNYEEKYKKALTWMQGLYKGLHGKTKEEAEEAFPELKESEDERIRKELIDYFKENNAALAFRGISNESVIAWLEKQAQKPSWSEKDKNMLEWVMGYLENKMLNTPISEERTACKNAIAWLEEKLKGEQKPADKVEPKFKTGDRIIGIVSGMQYYITKVCDDHYCTKSGCIIMFCAQENFELYKQKSAWSEEDENFLDGIIANLEYLMDRANTDTLKQSLQKRIDWLKSIKERYTWKPSDEQIGCLSDAIQHYNSLGYPASKLKELLDDLKKQKE